MGYHVGGLITHFTGERRSDFLEMALHHFLTLYLYGGAYMVNVWEVGGVIAFLHDIADVTGNWMKVLVESKYPNFTAVNFVWHMIVWAYTRMIVLPILIYEIALYFPSFGPPVFPFGFPVLKPIFCYMLSAMCFLHYYWFGIFISMMKKYVLTGKTEDK